MKKIETRYLLAAALVLLLSLVAGARLTATVPAADYDVKLDAAARMQACMDRVKAYKEEAGLGVSADDTRRTGMIGEPYTFITTTSGALEAKRTTADPDMAALLVHMLHEAGVRAGDTVGAGCSGSFPALNLALLCACEAMDVRVVYIASVGASTYGANQPELTFPDMALRLAAEGLIPAPDAFSMGGYRDCGLDMDPALAETIRARLEQSGVPMLYTEDYAENLARRMALYEEKGPITCFVGVGGNLTTIGQGEVNVPYGFVRAYTVTKTDEKSGLMERYNAAGLPVLHLLNIKKLVADYGLPYDPEQPTVPGQSAVYYTKRFPVSAAVLGLCGAAAVLIVGRRRRSAVVSVLLLALLTGCAAPTSAEPEEAPAPPAAEAAEEERYAIAAGTEWENTVVARRGAAEGATVYVIGGVHGDETAGWTAANELKALCPTAGTVYILSPANVYGAAHDQRETKSKRDLNRNFPGDPEGWDAERIAASIYADIADKRPDLLLDLHETRGPQESAPERDDLRDSIIVNDVAPIADLVWELTVEGEWNLLGSPPEGSVNRTVSENLGIPVVTVETWRGEALETRVERQLAFVDTVLRFYGML